ncbi:hypothetical protein CI109_101600 [Kwoniella shandongensis]|uniref:DNA repair protein rhp7 treble clef domain-containing protein n=1 Tax=Kwoniella shandongensis TaxID=1734106 RepID=A0A5M6C6M4_9TREE|nr:uncharacterized protein CI109_001274 [Kwoniella shandongensis]KAA5530471.1 hypothetical protein CI109_001274 [Kwoniella shandongensis]
MSRSRRAAGAVRGPASALTSFLAGLGVEPSERLTTWGDTNSINRPEGTDDQPSLAHDGPVLEDSNHLDPAGAVTARTVVAGPSEVGEGVPDVQVGGAKRKRDGESDSESGLITSKRTRAASIDSDDLDADNGPVAGPSKSATPVVDFPAFASSAAGPLKAVGEFMDCGQCGKKFTVTAYTKEHPTHASTFLCVNCCYALGIDPFAKPKKGAAVKKKPVAKKDVRSKVVHYEERKGVNPLGDICIHLIGRFIENVDQLGDIGGINMDKVCKIISKGRRLTPETAPLFYSADRETLAMYDCTRLTPEAFITLGKLCPNLQSLHLHLCGQLSTDAVTSWGKSLKHLKRLELFAPFLVRKEGWISFLKAIGKRLEGLLITQSPRIDLETIKVLVKSCPNLTELRLAEIGQLDSDCLAAMKPLRKLKFLDLSFPSSPLPDDAVSDLLSAVGGNLETLILADNPDLTDVVLLSIAKHCPKLRNVSLRNMVELTDEGVAAFFELLKKRNQPGLVQIDLEKGHDLREKALHALIDHSGSTVEKLSLLGWREVPADSISELISCSQLKELNIGWCRNVTDSTVKDILEGCQAIELMKVWGCNQLSDAVPRKKGVNVIGIETHSI